MKNAMQLKAIIKKRDEGTGTCLVMEITVP